MKHLEHNGEPCGVEGEFVIDLYGNLMSPTIDMRALGLQIGQVINVNGAFLRVSALPTRRCVPLDDHALSSGPVERVYFGNFWRRPDPVPPWAEAVIEQVESLAGKRGDA